MHLKLLLILSLIIVPLTGELLPVSDVSLSDAQPIMMMDTSGAVAADSDCLDHHDPVQPNTDTSGCCMTLVYLASIEQGVPDQLSDRPNKARAINHFNSLAINSIYRPPIV